MPFLTLGLLGLFSVLPSPVSCADSGDSSVWGKYNNALGAKKMLTAFESADVFGRSIQTETKLVGRNQLSCFNYQNGAEFAKEYRSYEQDFHTMNVSVFYVSDEEDIMCFIVDYPEEGEENQRTMSSTLEVSLGR